MKYNASHKHKQFFYILHSESVCKTELSPKFICEGPDKGNGHQHLYMQKLIFRLFAKARGEFFFFFSSHNQIQNPEVWQTSTMCNSQISGCDIFSEHRWFTFYPNQKTIVMLQFTLSRFWQHLTETGIHSRSKMDTVLRDVQIWGFTPKSTQKLYFYKKNW